MVASLLLVAVLSMIASMVATVSGFGFATIMVPVLTFFMPFTDVMLLVGLLHLVNTTWRSFTFYPHTHLRLFFYFGIPSIASTILGAYLIPELHAEYVLPFLGIFLIAYVLLIWLKPHFKIKATIGNAVLGGALSGFFAGIFGIKGALKSMFLTAYHLPKKQYIATMSLLGFVTDLARVGAYIQRGFTLSYTITWGLLLFVPAIIIGVYGARCVVRYIPQESFRPFVTLFLFLLGLKLLLVDGLLLL